MSEKINENPEQAVEQAVEQQEEQPDAIALLATELKQIREALGIGVEQPNQSSLISRLNSIESNLGKTEREKNLPSTITKSQAADPSFLRKAGIDLKDFSSGKVRIEG
ncbi:MAG: hypothetical protein ICV63_11735 [Coleofasciculus sp. Co-bin14]|nr:hypothetical protein [Coleofasciculus sp. Co-bin14]